MKIARKSTACGAVELFKQISRRGILMSNCKVCGEKMSSRGKVHYKCTEKVPSSGYNAATILMSKCIEKMQKDLAVNVKHWNVKMGDEKLREMFPDLVK
jgi:hypothetical protein